MRGDDDVDAISWEVLARFQRSLARFVALGNPVRTTPRSPRAVHSLSRHRRRRSRRCSDFSGRVRPPFRSILGSFESSR